MVSVCKIVCIGVSRRVNDFGEFDVEGSSVEMQPIAPGDSCFVAILMDHDINMGQTVTKMSHSDALSDVISSSSRIALCLRTYECIALLLNTSATLSYFNSSLSCLLVFGQIVMVIERNILVIAARSEETSSNNSGRCDTGLFLARRS